MPIYEYQCLCGETVTKFSHKISPSMNCKKCGKGMNQVIKDSVFVAPEADLTFVGNRIRMQEGIFYDQDYKARRKTDEQNKEAALHNELDMQKKGFVKEV